MRDAPVILARSSASTLDERICEVADIAGRHAAEVDTQARFPHEAVTAMKERRLLGELIPTALGGEGAGIDEIVGHCLTLGRKCASVSMIFAMHQIQIACLLAHGDGSRWHREALRRIATSQLLIASATTEAGIGGDIRSSSCAANADIHSFDLVKDAPVISYGQEADGILVTARRTPSSQACDQVLIVLFDGDYTLTKTAAWNSMGMRGTCSHGFQLKARASCEQILPVAYETILADTMLPVSHLAWGGAWLGLAHASHDLARAYVRHEMPGDSPRRMRALVRLGGVRRALQLLDAVHDGCLRRYVAACAPPALMEMNSMKISLSEGLIPIVHESLMICGLDGYSEDGPYALGRLLRDAHAARLMIHNDRIAANMDHHNLLGDVHGVRP